jgi:CelD/BcsL family acetyltransferase involved in cellulose biosynthesis
MRPSANLEFGMRVRVVDSPRGFAECGGAWNDLVDASVYPNVFQRWEWVSTWWNWFGNGRRLRVLWIADGSKPVGIVPMYSESWTNSQSPGGGYLRFIGAGGPTYPEYLGPIVHRDYVEPVSACVTANLQSKASHWRVIEFPDTPPDDAGTMRMIHDLANRYPTMERPGEVCFFTQLPQTFEELLSRVGSRTRQKKRYQVRRAKTECAATLEVIESPGALSEAFPTIVALSSSSRGRLGKASPFANEAYAGFHRDVMGRLGGSAVVRVYLMRFGDKPAAFLYGFLFRGKFYDFQTGFDREASRLSPGDVLGQLVFEHLIEEGAVEFDYLRGSEAYKNIFASGERRTVTTHVFRRKGALYSAHWLYRRVVHPAGRRVKAAFQTQQTSLRT